MSWFAISWQSIIAGSITALAVSIVLAVLGIALGFTVVKPTSDHPASGLGTAFGVWGVLSVILSLAAGGFAAGMFSVTKGAEHGFMVWATVLVVGALFSGVAVGSALKTVGSLVRGVGSGAASVASTVGSSVGEGVSGLASHAVDQLQKNAGLDFDTHQLGDKVSSVLEDTGVEKLQPEYLKDQLHEAKADLMDSLHKLRLNTDAYDQIATDFLAKQKSRFDDIAGDIDRDAAVAAVMNKRGVPRAEAETEVDNAFKTYQKAVGKAKEAVGHLQQQIQDTREYLVETANAARVKAERFASSAARSALAAAVALVLGAIVCCYAGYFGNRFSLGGDAVIMQERTAIEIPAGTARTASWNK